MEHIFDAHQPHQQQAIAAVVDVFADAVQPDSTHLSPVVPGEVLANPGRPCRDRVLANVQAVQRRQGLVVHDQLWGSSCDLDIEMETGTGKTYVYVRTMFELAQRYGVRRCVVVVPSVAVREGVLGSIEAMREHLTALYGMPFEVSVYDGRFAQEVRHFATSTTLHIMVVTIDSLRGSKNTRVMQQPHDRLGGFRPVDYVQATRPVVVLDEPQNMESALSHTAVGQLNPWCTLRYSATHRQERNTVFRLGPVAAHQAGLVKRITVADVAHRSGEPFFHVLEVTSGAAPCAVVEVDCVGADGVVTRNVVQLPSGADVAQVTGNGRYDGWRVTSVTAQPAFVELSGHGVVARGEALGGATDEVLYAMMVATVRAHLRKEQQVRHLGVKVLSLFFVDAVAHYMGAASSGDAQGKFARWFDEILVAESRRVGAQLAGDPQDARRAYFASMRRAGGVAEFVDTSGATAKDQDAYDMIMRDKARLLSAAEPVRFVFSHSALREGWDNPNVFQVCVLRSVNQTMDRRQTIGRGLRLPVDQSGRRVTDRAVAELTVVANESYRDFAAQLQRDYAVGGVAVDRVTPAAFTGLTWPVRSVVAEPHEAALGDTDMGGIDVGGGELGEVAAGQLFQELVAAGMLTAAGEVTARFAPRQAGFALNLSERFARLHDEVARVVSQFRVADVVAPAGAATPVAVSPVASPVALWWRKVASLVWWDVPVDPDVVVQDAVRWCAGLAPEVSESLESGQSKPISASEAAQAVQWLQRQTGVTAQTAARVMVGSGLVAALGDVPHVVLRAWRSGVKQALGVGVASGFTVEGCDVDQWRGRYLSSAEEQVVVAFRRFLTARRAREVSCAAVGAPQFVALKPQEWECLAQLGVQQEGSEAQVVWYHRVRGGLTCETPLGPVGARWVVVLPQPKGAVAVMVLPVLPGEG